jgi:hypothetical protein
MILAISSDRLLPTTTSSFSGTLEDFVRALRTLSAGIESDTWQTHGLRMRRVRFTCSYAAWVKVFGEVETVADHIGPQGYKAPQNWQYECADGSLLCFGYRIQEGHEDARIVIKAISLVQTNVQ